MSQRSSRPSLFRHVLDRLGSDIVQGKFSAAGSLQREQDLCDYLGASRSVVREVTRVLAEKGMLKASPKVGIRIRPETDWNVTDIDVLNWLWQHGRRTQYVKDFLEFRLIFEPMASFQAALRATPEQQANIVQLCHALIEANEKLMRDGDRDFSIAADIAFHSAIYKASGNHMLTYLGGNIAEVMFRQVRETTEVPGSFGLGLPLHEKVAQSIAKRDAASAYHYSQMLVRMPYEDYISKHSPSEPKMGMFTAQTADLPLVSVN